MKIEIIHGDLLQVNCDAIVNPTDIYLSGNGGLDKIIQQKGGNELKAQCNNLRPKMKKDLAVVTDGCRLPFKHIIHVASPHVRQEKNENYEFLKQCYWNILTKASGQRDIHHLALPLVGTGVGGYSLLEPYYTIPVALTPVTILSAIALFPHEYIHCRPLEKITIVCHSLQDYIRMKETYKWLFNVHLTPKYDRLHGAMLGGAIGDAFGYPVEFSNAQDSWIKEYILDPETNKALISDDTQMTLFTATGLLFGYTRSCLRGIGADYWHYIGISYQDWYKTQYPQNTLKENPYRYSSWRAKIPELNHRRAPGTTGLSSIEQGLGSIEHPLNHSKGCGGVMRIAPIPLYGAANRHWDQKYNARACAQTAALTHGHPLGWLPAAALGNILFDIMIGFSLSYAIEDTIRLLQKQYGEYEDTKTMVDLIERAVLLAENNGYTSSVNLIAEFDIIEQLGEGWVGEEALAIGLFCALIGTGRGFDQCLWNAVGHRGDSDSTGTIAGQIWGAYYGKSAIEEKWLKDLELREVIEEVADDLYNDNKMSEYGSYQDPVWIRKYMSGKYNEPVNNQNKYELYHTYFTDKEQITVQDGTFIQNGETTGHYTLHDGGTITGYFDHSSFTVLHDHANHNAEIFCDHGPDRWLGTLYVKTDELNNPLEVKYNNAYALNLIKAISQLVLNTPYYRNLFYIENSG